MGQTVLFSNIFHPTIGCNHLSIASQRIMVTAELQTSLQYHLYFLWDITFIFFCLGFVSRTLTNHRTAGKGRGYFFLLLSTTSTRFANRLVFSVCSYQRDLMMNEDVASGSWYHTTFFYIKTSIRVNKGAGFLDLLLNISFQPLIIVVKHSIIKLDVTELLDPPQVFTC